MERIKRFISCGVPVSTCTLRCHYCYITQHKLFAKSLPKFKYSAETVRKALSVERLGGVCLINFCGGGETLLPPEVLGYVKVLLEEGHYVMVVTNATLSKRFDEIASMPPELTKRLFFKFSYHYMELKERKLLDVFFRNVKLARDVGCSFTLEITPSDELVPYINELTELALKEVGAMPHVTVARDERSPNVLPILTSMPDDEYVKTWSVFDSELFRYKKSIFNVKRKEFCYAGDWSFIVNLGTGVMSQCYSSYTHHNIFDDPTKPIPFCAIGANCGQHHCYNGHAFLVLGDIPELETPTYGDLRNRICIDGTEWLKPEMKSFMNTHLWETNEEYSAKKKNEINEKMGRLRKIKAMKTYIRNAIGKMKKVIK
ncbi:MAG: radical SAM protein [Prevotella sp.]|nr:radical SAM protein [Prevotella sp.]